MKAADVVQEQIKTTEIVCSHSPEPVPAEKNATLQTVSNPTAHYTLSGDQHWPDQTLNRILSAIDNFDAEEFSEVECLEMLIYLSSRRMDARHIAEAAIETYGSLAGVFQQPGKELRALLCMDHSATALLAIAKVSMKFVIAPRLSDRQELRSSSALMKYLALQLREVEQEILRVIFLDPKCRLIKDVEIARGTVDEVPIYPKEIAKQAMSHCASSVILAHNHLSDDPTPSDEDIKATCMTKSALHAIDITLHDHVIISRTRCLSMHKEGLI